MTYAGINQSFQDLSVRNRKPHHVTGLEFIAGPVKQPMLTLQRLVRKYRCDVGCLTDLVRCTVVADSLEDAKDCVLFVCLWLGLTLLSKKSSYIQTMKYL